MKKRIIRFTILVITLFTLFNVKAAVQQYDSAKINENVGIYNDTIAEMTSLGCDGTLTSQGLVNQCNTLELNKISAVAYLFNARVFDSSLITEDAQKILDSNQDNCSDMFSSNIKDILNKIFKMFYIAGPILLLLFGSMDFFNAIVAGDEKKRKANYTKFIRRAISLALLFVTPVLVKVLLNTFNIVSSTPNKYTCKYQSRKITITVKSRKKGKKYGPSDGSVLLSVDCGGDYQWCEPGQYVVVDTKYPGGVEGYSEMLRENGIKQNENGSWSDCCAGFAQAHACGLHNGETLTQGGVGLKHGDNSCNGISGGCTGIWAWNSDTCFDTEEEYMSYIIENIRQGIPVMTVVKVDGGGRHFVTVVGYRADTKGTDSNDMLILDSWDGYMDTFNESSRQKGTMSALGYGSHPCGKEGPGSGEFWASANRQ